MGLLTRVKAAVLFGCLLVVPQVFATDYFWSDASLNHRSPTAAGACEATSRAIYDGHPTQSFVKVGPTTVSGEYASCEYFYTWLTGPGAGNEYSGGNTQVGLHGDTCSAGTGPFDPATGTCTVAQNYQPGDKCVDQTGATAQNPFIWDAQASSCVKFFDAGQQASCKYMGKNYTTPVAYTVAGNITSTGQAVAPPTFTSDTMSCQVQTVSSSECTLNVAGAVTCNVTGLFTGEVNSAGTKDAADALCPDGKCPVKEPETKTKEEACSPTGNGSGGSTCTQTKETTQDGSQQCGTVNGAYKCVTKQPYSNGITTNITATSETLPDGSVKVTTVKDSSNTVCTDVKTCTTKTSTTTTHTTTKPNGTTTTDSSCKGTCSNNGGGLETNTGAGSGNPATGNGNGGNGDGEGGDGTADTTDNCAAPPPCDGDPFLCAILKQDHIDTCKLMADATAEQKAAAEAKTNAAYSSLDAHQSQMDNQVNGLLGQFQAATSGGASTGKCLPDKQIPLGPRFGSINLEFSKTCDSLAWVRLIVLAGAYLFAARVVFREV